VVVCGITRMSSQIFFEVPILLLSLCCWITQLSQVYAQYVADVELEPSMAFFILQLLLSTMWIICATLSMQWLVLITTCNGFLCQISILFLMHKTRQRDQKMPTRSTCMWPRRMARGRCWFIRCTPTSRNCRLRSRKSGKKKRGPDARHKSATKENECRGLAGSIACENTQCLPRNGTPSTILFTRPTCSRWASCASYRNHAVTTSRSTTLRFSSTVLCTRRRKSS